jgi:hypothetical protein
MPNSELENTRVQEAVKLIVKRYAKHLPTSGYHGEMMLAAMSRTGIDLWVKFMDDGPFKVNFSTCGQKPVRGSCVVCGFTGPKLGMGHQREIYINRTYANPTTVIHEFLHFFTHPNFTSRVPAPLNEAVTEYFTRKVLSEDSGEFMKDDRKGRYDKHHEYLGLQRSFIRSSKTKPKDYMKNYMKEAYFNGNDTAITFLLAQMGELVELLKSEDGSDDNNNNSGSGKPGGSGGSNINNNNALTTIHN